MPKPIIKARFKRTWELFGASENTHGFREAVNVPAGEYELEVIVNPLYPAIGYWMVIKGRAIGMAYGAWVQWLNGDVDWEEFEIELTVDGQKLDSSSEKIQRERLLKYVCA